MPPRIVVLDGHTLNPGDLDWGAVAELGELTVYPRSGPQVVSRAQGAEIVLTNKEILGAAEFEALPGLRYVGVLATGTNVVDLPAARARKLCVTNVPAYGTDSVAQHTVALILALANGVAEHAAAVNQGEWQRCPDFCFTLRPSLELAGKRLGVVGMGAIGRRVAAIGATLGMQVSAAHQSSAATVRIPGVAVEWLDLDELCARADVLTLHCPLTEQTHELINEQRLARMKPTALLINTGRGPLIDELALSVALNEQRIAGAGLDVLSSEPPREGNPLIGAPNCLITPHLAWATVEARSRLLQIAADNIRAFLNGTPRNVVS